MLKNLGKIVLVLCLIAGAIYVYSWYDLEFGSGAEARYEDNKRRMQKYLAEEAQKNAIWENCSGALRTKADAATLQMQLETRNKTENGWRADIHVEDATGRLLVTCYTDNSGQVIRLVTR